MVAYLISEVLCNIYQVCIFTVRKAASPELPQRLDHERSLWKAFQSTRPENYLLGVYCWRAIARQHTILYNRAKSAKFFDVRSKTCAVDPVFDIRGSCDPGLL